MRSPRLSPLPPDLALQLSPPRVRALLRRFGAVPLDPSDPFSVAEALSYRLVPALLADATRIATLIGREAILETMAALARAVGWMKSMELGQKITPGAELPDQTVRKARQILGERLHASFKAAKIAMPDGLAERLVEFERSKGYRLGVRAIVR